MYGLSHDNPDLHFTGIDYALYTERAEGRVYVYENGTNRGQVGTWTSGDRFRVAVEGGVVKYKKNNTVLYTSQVSPTYPLFVDTSLYNGNTLSNVVISGDFTGAGLRYVLQDIQGTSRAVLKSDATVAARHDYLPFGEEIGTLGSRSTTPGYGGADTNRWNYGLTERDQKSGLDHTWFRKYENKAGRMTSPDPLPGSSTDPQSFNRYSYVLNDPVNLVDPTGLHFEFSCRGNHVWKAHIEGGGDYVYRGELCGVRCVDDGPYQGVSGDGFLNSGEKNALKVLGKTHFKLGTVDVGDVGQVDGKNVTLDPQQFNEKGSPLFIATNLTPLSGGRMSMTPNFITLTGKDFAAFMLAHELGHRTKSYGKYDKDGSPGLCLSKEPTTRRFALHASVKSNRCRRLAPQKESLKRKKAF